jgi:hypothetical protein
VLLHVLLAGASEVQSLFGAQLDDERRKLANTADVLDARGGGWSPPRGARAARTRVAILIRGTCHGPLEERSGRRAATDDEEGPQKKERPSDAHPSILHSHVLARASPRR